MFATCQNVQGNRPHCHGRSSGPRPVMLTSPELQRSNSFSPSSPFSHVPFPRSPTASGSSLLARRLGLLLHLPLRPSCIFIFQHLHIGPSSILPGIPLPLQVPTGTKDRAPQRHVLALKHEAQHWARSADPLKARRCIGARPRGSLGVRPWTGSILPIGYPYGRLGRDVANPGAGRDVAVF